MLIHMAVTLHSHNEFEQFLRQQPAAAVYFSGPDCSVCTVLKPRVMELLLQRFTSVATAEVDCAAAPELAAQLGVLTIPTLIVYFDGSELLRKVRNFSPAQLADELARPYSLFFDA